MTRVLVTNDDGVESPGLHALAGALHDAGLEVVVAAPSWDSSGASASLTGIEAHGHLTWRYHEVPDGDLAVRAMDASPAMITVAAIRGAFGPPPDLVVSGINRGRNTGRAILFSGTVGAAFTALNLDVPGVAVSVDASEPTHWETGADFAVRAVRWMEGQEPRVVLNINVPDRPTEDLAGTCHCPLADVGAVQTTVQDLDDGRTMKVTYKDPKPAAEGTDAALLDEGWAVITALRPVVAESDCDLSSLAGPGPRVVNSYHRDGTGGARS